MKPGASIGGKYRLTRQLGSGAMGVVWAAVHEGLAREVALKLILQPNAEMRIRLLREARACGALKHPNIVEVLDVDQTADGDPYLVMQLLSGETLGELLQRQRRLEVGPAARVAQDVARALVAAHAAGIVHRDLKPANIFLHDQLGQGDVPVRIVKVLDFGVSKNVLGEADGLATVTGGMVGSPAYMSPEQAQAKRDIDFRSDLWSLGVVLFEMLTGRRPFTGEAPQLISKIVLERAPSVAQFVRHADPGMVQIVSHCLERDRAARVQTAAQLVEMLAPYSDGAVGFGPRFASEASIVTEAPRPPAPSFPQVEAPRRQAPQPSRPPAPQPSRPDLPRAHAEGDDGDDMPTARLDPRMLGKIALPPRPAVSAPAPEARVVIAPPTPPPSAAASPTGTLQLDPPVPASRAFGKQTMPLGDGPVKTPTFPRPPTPSGGGFAANGTVRMSPEPMGVASQSVTAPLPAPPAPPPPSADGSGGWPAANAFNPPSSSSNPHISFNPPSSPSNPHASFNPPSSSSHPGAVSVTAPLDTDAAALTAPLPRQGPGQAPFDSGAAGLSSQAAPPRRRLGVIVVAAAALLAFTILTAAVLQRLMAGSPAPAASVSSTASASAAVPAAPSATATAVAAEPASSSASAPATAVPQPTATASAKAAKPKSDPHSDIKTVPGPGAKKNELPVLDPWRKSDGKPPGQPTVKKLAAPQTL